MKKLISYALLCTVILLTLCTASSSALALGVDPSVPASLTLHYKNEGAAFEGLKIVTYHIAGINEDTTLTLTGEFADYPININAITSNDEWLAITSTLVAYIAADNIAPTYTATTDENGTVCFENIPQGLYLTLSVTVESDSLVTVFKDFLTVVPSYGDQYVYDVVAYPKRYSYTPSPEEVEYKVVKQWQDNGYPNRPESVEVCIYKDGKLHSTQTLNSENNWCYTWRAPDDGSVWTAIEKEVPAEYTVTTVASGTVITITNVYDYLPPPPPTGDTSVSWHYVLISIASGLVLIMIATRRRRLDT